MADVFTPAKRSKFMAGVGAKDTAPELLVRKELHRRGYRYRLHGADLPGKPDIVLPKYNAVVMVNGCFWHGHDCALFKWPKSRVDFWREKIQQNKERDLANIKDLLSACLRVAVVWECSLKGRHKIGIAKVANELEAFLASSVAFVEVSGGHD